MHITESGKNSFKSFMFIFCINFSIYKTCLIMIYALWSVLDSVCGLYGMYKPKSVEGKYVGSGDILMTNL